MLKTLKKLTNKITGRADNHAAKEQHGQIIALGGGGFSENQDNLLLDEYLLAQTKKSKPRVLFLPTAGGDHEDYIAKFYRAYKKLNCYPIHLSLSKKAVPFKRLEQLVLKQDLIFVGGGSPRFLMQVWRKCGMDKIIKQAWKQGIVLSGMSAGAICWYEDGFKNPKDDIWRRIKCLGFLEGSFCPHYDKRGELRTAYRKMISSGELDSGYGVQDGVALHYIGTELKHVISDSPDARAYHVKKTGFRVIEKEIRPDFIGRIVDIDRDAETHLKPVNGNSIEIVKDYIRKINEHDLNGMLAVTTEDTVFIDSMGINASGKSNMREAWNVFLTFFPDYKVRVKEIIEKNGLVAIFGTAAGTLATDGKILEENRFEIPASWTAVVQDGKIAKWRVYADNEPVRKLINKYENQTG